MPAEAALFMVVIVVSIVSLTVRSIVKIVITNKTQQWGKDGNTSVPPLFEKMFEKVIAERDAKIVKMEARIRVLEEIVTDSYGSKKLASEIDRLRDDKA